MKLASLGFAVALGAAPAVAHAQVSVSGGISFNFGSLQGDAVADTDVFYDQLSPYGVWVNDPTVGQAFIPDEANFTPYTNGYWEDTDVGLVWVSNEPFSWATSHYGRWFFDNDYGRWAWVPDTTWGPNWVNWYETDGEFGWSPLAPDVIINAGYQPPIAAYHFVAPNRLFDENVSSYYVPRDRVTEIQRRARPIEHRENVHGHTVITGPGPERLAAHHITVRPKPITNTKTLGRLDANQARTIEQRAKERKPQIEQQNAKRLDAKPELKRAAETKAQKSPTRPEQRTQTTRPEPTRTETTRPEPKAQPTRPETQRTEPNRNETNRNELNRTMRPEPKAETTRPEPKAETTRPEPQRTEPTRPEPKAETTRPEPKAEPARPEPQRAEPTRPEPKATRPEPKAEMTRPEPKAEPKAAPKADMSRKDKHEH